MLGSDWLIFSCAEYCMETCKALQMFFHCQQSFCRLTQSLFNVFVRQFQTGILEGKCVEQPSVLVWRD